MLIIVYMTVMCRSFSILAYSNKLFTLTKENNTGNGDICRSDGCNQKLKERGEFLYRGEEGVTSCNTNFIVENKCMKEDLFKTFNDVVQKFIFGESYGVQEIKNISQDEAEQHKMLQFTTGRALRKSELFKGKSGVHFPIAELVHRGCCVLNVTDDYMQTAIDAFAIFTKGSLEDIRRLPADYVLNSARTISMMKISHEKLAATWDVVKGSRDPIQVTYETLEKYRPLFKHLSGSEMTKLNLTDHRILSYIGTHPDLNRHQVGLVASKYIKLNPRWSEPRYLNTMNNLICGVPIKFMKEILENTYLQLSHQVFYHTRACDPLQRRFYLGMMTRTQALGKAYSWNAQDVSRLGLLLAEVEGEELGSIKPEALTGLTAQVMTAMRPEKLLHLTNVQLKYIREKPFDILSKKLKKYNDQHLSAAVKHMSISVILLKVFIIYLSIFLV